MGMGGRRLAALYPWESLGGVRVDARAGLEECGKSRLYRNSTSGPSIPQIIIIIINFGKY